MLTFGSTHSYGTPPIGLTCPVAGRLRTRGSLQNRQRVRFLDNWTMLVLRGYQLGY